ncbi:hypothetical protein K1719_001870 [Acacia pycnantha]|nr:hypothetical protein K1719_001870 [Acacia pycnantha]
MLKSMQLAEEDGNRLLTEIIEQSKPKHTVSFYLIGRNLFCPKCKGGQLEERSLSFHIIPDGRVINDYKIVKIYDFEPAEVYSLSTGSWKKVEFSNHDLLEGISFLGSFAATDEAIYWLSYRNRIDILSFDIATEVFTVIPMPEVPHIHRNIKLIAYENKLALFSGIELWLMEEEATSGESRQRWSKTKVFGSPRLRSLHPMTIWRNEVVFEFEPQPKFGIYLFNLTSNELKEFLFAREYGIRSAFNYVESLVSLGDKNSTTSS